MAAEAKPNNFAGGCLLLLVLGGVYVWYNATHTSDSNPADSSSPADSAHVGIGEVGILRLKGSDTVFVASTIDDFNRMFQLITAHDNEGFAKMVLGGQVMPIPSGTQCRVIDVGVMKSEVRILGGGFANESGWVESSCVAKN